MNVVLANDPVLSHNMLPEVMWKYAKNVRFTVVDERPTVVQSYVRSASRRLPLTLLHQKGNKPSRLHRANPAATAATTSPDLAAMVDMSCSSVEYQKKKN